MRFVLTILISFSFMFFSFSVVNILTKCFIKWVNIWLSITNDGWGRITFIFHFSFVLYHLQFYTSFWTVDSDQQVFLAI